MGLGQLPRGEGDHRLQSQEWEGRRHPWPHRAQIPPWGPLPRGRVHGSTGTVMSLFSQEGHSRGHQVGFPGQHLDQVSEQPSRQKCPQGRGATPGPAQ